MSMHKARPAQTGRAGCCWLLALEQPHVGGLGAFRPWRHVELDGLPLIKRAVARRLDRAEMHEDVLAGLRGDEAVALVGVEPFHGSNRHVLVPPSTVLEVSTDAGPTLTPTARDKLDLRVARQTLNLCRAHTNGSLLSWGRLGSRVRRPDCHQEPTPMTTRRPCPPAPGLLEDFAAQFDGLFSSLAQRRGLRDYLQGLLLPRDRNKTLTGLAAAEPVVGAQHREVQRLQWFLSESTWDHQVLNERRVRLLCQDPATAPNDRGVLVIDDTGDRKDGTATAHVARQYLGSVGKTDNGIVAVTSLWADERCYWPVHAVPYTPASRLAAGKRDPGFRTKPQLAVELVEAARQAGIRFRAVVADCCYGDNPGFTEALGAAKVPFVLALKPRKGTWAPAEAAHTPTEAAGELDWQGPRKPGRWRRIQRRFRDGHTETWWAADAQLGGWGPDRRLRLVVATTDPAKLPGHSSWYLLTNLPRPATRRA